MNIQSSGKEPLNYSFNQEKWSNKPLMQELPLQKAYFLLVNVEEHPEILPFAFDLSTSHLASVEKHFDTPEFSGLAAGRRQTSIAGTDASNRHQRQGS